MGGHKSITKLLLNHGANVNSKGGFYGTALQAAAHRGHRKLVELLLDAGADVHREGFSHDAFHAASEGGHEGIVRLLLERGFKSRRTLPREVCFRLDPRNPRNSLYDASASRCPESQPSQDHQPESKAWRVLASVTNFSYVIKTIRGDMTSELETIQPYRGRTGHGIYDDDIYNDEIYALRVAAASGHVTVVELLINQLDRMDIPTSQITAALTEACGNGQEKVVNHLLSNQIMSKELKAALVAAALNGHLSVVNLLVSHEHRLGLTTNETVVSLNKACRSICPAFSGLIEI